MGINVVVDKKGKVLTGDKAAGFDYATGTVYIKKKSGVIDINSMQGILKLDEINFVTKLKCENIIAIAESYIKSKGES